MNDGIMDVNAPQEAEGAAMRMWAPAPMHPPSEADIRLVIPHALSDYVGVLVSCWSEIEAAEIVTPLRWSHFFSQFWGHEIGGGTIVRENTGWTPEQIRRITGQRFAELHPRVLLCRGDPRKLANVVYGSHPKLGNTGPDDGWIYRGGGPPQLTGRDAYRECGNDIGVDLEGQPELIEIPEVGLRAAIWVWSRHGGLNQFADHNYGRTIGNAINRGNPFSKFDPIGYDKREQWFRRTWGLFGQAQALPNEQDLHLGAYGPKVERIQGQLRDLGYSIGATDGVYGPTMARAVAGFKADQRRNMGVELEPGDVIGGLTQAALDTAHPVALSPERTNITMQGLLAEGSTEMRAGQHIQNVGRGLTLTGLGLGLNEVGAFDSATHMMQSFTSLQYTMVPAIRAGQWALKNAFWVAVILGGIYCWRSGYFIKVARWTAHRLGFNLSR